MSQPLVEQLTERLGTYARAETVFGEPVERGDVTIIPVAGVIGGFGGGANGEGQDGGGGGGLISPLGYIEVTNAGTRFRPTWDPHLVLLAILALVRIVATLRGSGRRR